MEPPSAPATPYTLGLRHAFDADHIGAIDNTTRKLMADGQRPLGVGFFFSLGHSSVVFGLALLFMSGLGCARETSRPISSIAARTRGLARSAGSLPAERTVTRPAARWSRRAAAIWLRPALWTHTKRTSVTTRRIRIDSRHFNRYT